MPQKFLLMLDNPSPKRFSKFLWDVAFANYNKRILDNLNSYVLFFNTPVSDIVELINKHELGLYIILPFEQLLTNNKLLEATSFQIDDSKDNFFSYLDKLKDKKSLEEFDKALIDSFKHLLDYDADNLLDKINAKGNVENLNAVEKYCLEKMNGNDRN